MLKQLKTTRLFGIVVLTILVLGMFVSSAGASFGIEQESQKFAVLIAIDCYQDEHLRSLQYCKSDALALKETLIAGGVKENNIILMTDDTIVPSLQPTKKNIQNILAVIESQAKEGDMIFFSFSGMAGNYDGSSMLMPMDSEFYRNQWLGGLRVQEVLDTLGRSKAATRLLVLDTCLGGSNTTPLILPKKTAILLAATCGGTAYESPEFQGSVFTHYMIRGLQGEADTIGDENGKVDLTELFHFVKTCMAKHEEYMRPQIPGLMVSNDVEDIFGLEIVKLPNSTPKTGSVTIEPIPDSESQTEAEFENRVQQGAK